MNKYIFCLFCVLLLTGNEAFSQYFETDVILLKNKHFTQAQQLAREGYLLEAARKYQSAASNFEKKEYTKYHKHCQLAQAFCLIEAAQYEKAKLILETLNQQHSKEDLIKARIWEYFSLLYRLQRTRRLHKAITYGNKSLRLKQKVARNNYEEWVRAGLQVTYALAYQSSLKEAMARLGTIEEWLSQATPSKNLHYLKALYFHIRGFCRANKGIYLNEEAQLEHTRSTRIARKLYGKALKGYAKALHPKHPNVGVMWGNIATTWQMRIEELYDSLKAKYPKNLAKQFLSDMDKKPYLDSAAKYFDIGLKVMEQRYQNARKPITYFYWFAGIIASYRYYIGSNEQLSQEALELFQKSLQANISSSKLNDPLQDASFKNSDKRPINTLVLTQTLKYKIDLMLKLYRRDKNRNKQYLQQMGKDLQFILGYLVSTRKPRIVLFELILGHY